MRRGTGAIGAGAGVGRHRGTQKTGTRVVV